MSKEEKLIAELTNLQGTFTWNELVSLLNKLGYIQLQGSGSRVKFDNGSPEGLISLHKPHPGNEIKRYAKAQVLETLIRQGLI